MIDSNKTDFWRATMTRWQFGFTARDKSLQSASTRDPLGFELIWTTFGSRVVPKLSTVSRGATTFCVVLAHALLLDRFERERGFLGLANADQKRQALTLHLETFHALAVAHVTASGQSHLRANLPGIDTARRRLSRETPPSVKEHLLVNQGGMGMSGRYKRPLVDAEVGLLDEQGRLLDHARSTLEDLLSPLRNDLDLVYGVLETIADSKDEELLFIAGDEGPFGEDAILASASLRDLSGEMKSLLPVLAKALKIEPEGSAQHELYKLIDPESPRSPRVLYTQLLELLDGEERQRAQDVIDLEEILWRVETLFDRLWERSLTPELTRIEYNGEQEDMLSSLADRQAHLRRLKQCAPKNSPTLLARLDALEKLLEHTDHWSAFFQHLANVFHSEVVMQARPGSSPWVSVFERQARVLNGGYTPAFNKKGSWGRRYYVPTLTRFKADVLSITELSEVEDV